MLFLLGWLALAAFQQPRYDLLVHGARVLDGTGNPWARLDIGIRDGRIVALRRMVRGSADRIIDAEGLYLAPGFIDVHSHAGPALAGAELSGAPPLLAQGITTVVVNHDGGGPVDLVTQRRQLLEHGLGVNVVQLVPHGSIRRQVLGMDDRAPSAEELERMKELVRQGMRAGAAGLSTGLYYAPGSYATTEEVIALAVEASRLGGLYTSHIRDEADYSVGLLSAVDEVIRIARTARLPAIVSHVKALGPHVWGQASAIVDRIEKARGEGLAVYADQYPYTASATSLTAALVPRWAQAGGGSALRERMDSAEQRARIRQEMIANLERRGGARRLQFRRSGSDPSIEGRSLENVARERGLEPVDAALELVEAGGAGVVSFNMSGFDVKLLMAQPWTMTCSDGGLVPLGQGVPHPRNYGTFPRKLKVYAEREKVLTLAEAVRSMTSLPATVFGLHGRGLVREGAVADLVLFDLKTLGDPATFQAPHQPATGVVHLVINGKLALTDGRPTRTLAGEVLRGPAGER